MTPTAIALLLFAASFLLSLAVTPLVCLLAIRKPLAPEGESGSAGDKPVPIAGGVVLFAAWLLPLAALYIFGGRWRELFGGQATAAGVLLAASAMFVLGLWHDIRGVNAQFRLPIQFTMAVALYLLNIRIEAVSNPFGAPIQLGMFSPIITAFWIVGLTYAVNRMDGVAGLAAGVAGITAIVMALASRSVGSSNGIVYAVPIIGSCAGFLVYNFPPARVLMGNGGSLFLGATLATISLLSSQKGHVAAAVLVPLIAFGVPLTNASLALLRRFISGRALFEKDHRHVHHMLLALGLSERAVVITLYGVAVVFGTAALLLVNASGLRALLIVCVLLAAVVVASRQLGYHEFRHVWGYLRHGIGHRGELVFRRQLVAIAGERVLREASFDRVWDKVLLVARVLMFDRVRFEPYREVDQPSDSDRAGLQERLWARDHQSETAAPAGRVDIPLTFNGRTYGTIAFARMGRPRIKPAEHAALTDLCNDVAAWMAKPGQEDKTDDGAHDAIAVETTERRTVS